MICVVARSDGLKLEELINELDELWDELDETLNILELDETLNILEVNELLVDIFTSLIFNSALSKNCTKVGLKFYEIATYYSQILKIGNLNNLSIITELSRADN